jgi:hypothetical protein
VSISTSTAVNPRRAVLSVSGCPRFRCSRRGVSPSPPLAAAPTAPEVAVATTQTPLTVDGRLDEPGWAQAQEITRFTRYVPAPGGAPAERVSVRVLQDDETLYIGVLVEDSKNPIRARLSPREDLNDDDQIGVYLDTFNDERNGFVFYFNALGVQQDARWANGEWVQDWNTVLDAEATRHTHGFTLEIAIPFRSLRYPDTGAHPQTWGLIVTRKVPGEGAKYSFPPLQRGHPQLFSQAARLTGITPAAPARPGGADARARRTPARRKRCRWRA